MDVIDQHIEDKFAAYNADCMNVMPSLKNDSVHLSIYSPPFCGLYNYSSNPRDLSNCDDYDSFFDHYGFIVDEIARITMPGRISAVHCADISLGGANSDHGMIDFPGDVIKIHSAKGFQYIGRHCVWKEPLGVRNRTMSRGLAHRQVVEDSSLCSMASADYLLLFRKAGKNPVPIAHPQGLTEYAGERTPPADVQEFRGYKGNQIKNRYSHWIWRQYASAFWDDVRIDRVLPYKESKDPDDERHVHPLQLDVIDRIIVLRSNPGEVVLTPFMGVGSEAYSAVVNKRKAIGIELKPSYYRQAVRNLKSAAESKVELTLL